MLKLAVFYFTLCNLAPKLRSKVRHIQLAAIAKSEHLKKYGANAILQPIIQDIKKLVSAKIIVPTQMLLQEAGYTFSVGGALKVKYGTLCLLPADNLASNALGGFKAGSTANRGCRHCLATLSEMKTIFCEVLLRTSTDHSTKCDQLEAAATKHDRDTLSTAFGINHRSILNELEYYDVCSGALVQDVMHDVLEGV